MVGRIPGLINETLLNLTARQARTPEARHSEEFINASYSKHEIKDCGISVESVDGVGQR